MYGCQKSFQVCDGVYADDGLIHCSSERQGAYVLEHLRSRLKDCGLELHTDKTRLIYCADGFRRRKTDHSTSFEFLGYEFQSRRARSRKTGVMFNSFQPGVSRGVIRSMIYRIKYKWCLRNRVDLNLESIAREINAVVRGWLNYYGKFYKSVLYKLCKYLNQTLSFWSRHKYKRLYSKFVSCYDFVKAEYLKSPKLFAHWEFFKVY